MRSSIPFVSRFDRLSRESDRLLGDGVNVAARLEGIAEPGGIYISDAAYHQVQDKISAEFVDMGEQNLKNIARPVRAFAIRGAGSQVSPDVTITAASVPKLSLVVLPFGNLGGGADQDYFVDGLTEDLTTELSRLPESFVIACNTAFTFKGKPIDVKWIGRELGVRYVLEGSVRKSGQRVRVNAQLIDAETGDRDGQASRRDGQTAFPKKWGLAQYALHSQRERTRKTPS